jgi:chemotaxis protein histidine kinase CheA
MFNNSTAALSMIMDINPLAEKEIILPSGRKIIVSAAFQRIEEDGEVRNLMVLFQDMTGIIESREALEAERQIHESELEQIAAILKLGPRIFEEFVLSAREVFHYIRENRENFGRQEILNKAFRDTHSLKGTARYLKFNVMEQLAHQMESDFAALRNKAGSDPLPPELDERLDSLEEELKSIDAIIERFRQFSRGGESEAPEMDIFRLRLEEMCADLSRELEKEVRLDVHSDWTRLPGLQKIQASVFHLLRNAMDHGIEDSFERLAAGKEETARLELSFRKEGQDRMLVQLTDDGRGLDFQALEQRALETGLLKPGRHFPSQILKTLFMPGFSSRDKANSISGRGVGLDAVRADMQALGGKINVKTAKGRGTSFNLMIPLASLEAE